MMVFHMLLKAVVSAIRLPLATLSSQKESTTSKPFAVAASITALYEFHQLDLTVGIDRELDGVGTQVVLKAGYGVGLGQHRAA